MATTGASTGGSGSGSTFGGSGSGGVGCGFGITGVSRTGSGLSNLARPLALCLGRRQFLLESAATSAPAGSRQREEDKAHFFRAHGLGVRDGGCLAKAEGRRQHNDGDQPGMKAARQRQGPLVSARGLGSRAEHRKRFEIRDRHRGSDRAASDCPARATASASDSHVAPSPAGSARIAPASTHEAISTSEAPVARARSCVENTSGNVVSGKTDIAE